MGYEITFLGTSGGPVENGNCSILIKPASLTYTQVIESQGQPLFMIDAGSGWRALAEIILNDSRKSKGCESAQISYSSQLALYEDSLQPHEYLSIPWSEPFSNLVGPPLLLSRQILAKVATMLLTHPHLDHIQSMVLNSAGSTEAGETKVMCASKFTTDALNTHIFNGVIWPDLVSLGFLSLQAVSENEPFTIAENAYTVTYFEVSHGIVVNNGSHEGAYPSSAFLFCDNTDQTKLLVFGDFEADSISRAEKNANVWDHVAPFVIDGSLKCVILECSTYSREPGVNLYGHMTPVHVMAEFSRLEALCEEKLGAANSRNSPSVEDLKVIVTHVKETYDNKDPRRRILSELQSLNEASGLRLNISLATNGVSVVV